MINKIKLIAYAIALLTTFNSVAARGENYIVQPGDELSHIAEKKILNSGLPLNLEQVMLTIYKLNPAVFINGDVNQLIPAISIYIPDKTEDYLQISKSDAINRLRDKNYMRELYSTASKLMTSGVSSQDKAANVTNQNLTQIVQKIETHQQDIDFLKAENARLSNNFKLLERAMGRLVILQGMLTNEVVKVKTKLFHEPLNTVESSKIESALTYGKPEDVNDNAPVDLPKLQETSDRVEDNAIKSIVTNSQIAPTSSGPATTENKSLAPQIIKKTVTQEDANIIIKLAENAKNLVDSLKKGNFMPSQEQSSKTFWLKIIIVIFLFIIMPIVWIFDFWKIRSKLKPTKTILFKDYQ